MTTPIKEMDLSGKVAVITGGSGIICSAMAKALGVQGVKTAILARRKEKVEQVAQEIQQSTGTESMGLSADVLDRESLIKAREEIHEKWGQIDFLINGAGGNSPKATSKKEKIESEDLKDLENTFFGLDLEGFENTFDLNFKGTLLPTMVFSQEMVERQKGSIVNVSSMNAFRPLTKIPAYSASKAAINNFTQWLAVHFAKTGVRVNAIAPGFLLTDQNRFLLVDEKTGQSTPRGEKIISGTPMERYGTPEDMTGTLVYLISDWAEFVTGVVIPVDGGFNAYSGV
ncbi:MAG: SDR family oxidoreductase [Marinilabiliaceae bacterium]